MFHLCSVKILRMFGGTPPLRSDPAKHLVQPDRQLTDPHARRVVNRIRDRRCQTSRPQFADALDSQWINERVFFLHHHRGHIAYVARHRDVILRQIGITVPCKQRVQLRRLVQRGA